MLIVFSSIALVTAITLACWLVVRCLGETRLGLQDTILRFGLYSLLVAPVFCLIYCSPYKLSIPIVMESASVADPAVQIPPITDSLPLAPVQTNEQPPVDTPAQLPPADDSLANHITQSSRPTTPSTASWSRATPIGYLLLIVWAVGCMVAFYQILRAHAGSRSIKKRSRELNDFQWHDALARATFALGNAAPRVQLRSSNHITSPLLIGIRTPTILIPVDLLDESISGDACEHILTHELIHVQRSDMATNMLLQVAIALWWWHPLIHWLKSRIEFARELICDATTSHYQTPEDYAETLLQLTVARGSEPSLALSISDSPYDLQRRVAWILSCPQLSQLRSVNRKLSQALFGTLCAIMLFAVTIEFTPVAAQELEEGTTTAVIKADKTQPTAASNDVELTAETMLTVAPLKSGPDLQGRIYMPDGSTAANADVFLLHLPEGGPKSWKPDSTRTKADGVFTFSGLAPGRYMFWSTTDDLVSNFNAIVGRQVVVEEKPSKLDVIEAKLRPGSVCSLKVTDAKTGQPIAGATIQVSLLGLIPEITTDQNGIAEYRNLRADDWKFTVHKPGYAYAAKSIPNQPLGSRAYLAIQLSKGGTLQGKVVDQNGEPVASSEITTMPNDIWQSPEFPNVTSKADGTFEVPDLPLDTEFTIAADSDSHQVVLKKFSISGRQNNLSLELVTPKKKAQVSTRIHVIDQVGMPIQNVSLVNRGFSEYRSDKTNADGNGKLEDISDFNSDEPPTGFYVDISAVGYAPTKIKVPDNSTLASTPINVVLKSVPVFVGRVVTPEGLPLENVQVMATDPNNRTRPIQSGRTDKDGVFVISDITGEVLLSYSPPAPYLGRIQARYEIQPDDKSPKEIRLEYRGGIRVRAVDAETGKEVTHYNVRVSYAEDHDSSGFTRGYSYGFPSELARGVNIAAGGTEFRMDDQRIGAPYMVNVTAAGYIPAKVPRVVSVKSDEAQITIVPMHRASPQNSMIVTGTLRDDNNAVANAKVCLVSSSKPEEVISWHNLENDFFKNQPECIQFLETTSNAEGKFRFNNVLRSTDTVEIYYFHPQGDQRFRNLKLDQSKSEHNFDLVASPMVSLLLRIDPQHYPEARYVSIALPFRENDAPPLPIAFERRTIQFSQFSNGEPIRVKLPPGKYRIEVIGKYVPSTVGNFGTSHILVRRNLTLSEEESGILLDL